MDYQKAGVNIDKGNEAVALIKSSVASTHNNLVLNNLGSFAAFFKLPEGYQEPVLVSCTDGVGTKLKLAIDLEIFNTIGIDLVAMSINDLICSGAKPLFFLDYFACHELDPNQIKQIIDGMVHGCKESDCALIGGEMAEMNDLYRPRDFDLAGFAVGVVERSKIIDGKKIHPDQNVYGFKSSGIHSNGFSLVRKIMTPEISARYRVPQEALLEPTKIYAKNIQDLLDSNKEITGIAHITGGGIQENLARILPENIDVHIEKQRIPIMPIFTAIQEAGNVTEKEMFRVFNMGVGLIIITPQTLEETEEMVFLGKTLSGNKKVSLI
ncbi:MAG: phosphoribosylformylglycinamidine cyclo-ligase [Candidatus Margulisiibacteriota bacterium]|jgi:phosphoribosylformylglycinamidine cyclo-ligase